MRVLVLVLVLLTGCGGGDPPPCATSVAGGPFTDADRVAAVTVNTADVPIDVTVTATVTGFVAGAEVYLAIGYAGSAYEDRSVILQAGESRTIVMRHTFRGSETGEPRADVYFGTLVINDHGARGAQTTDVQVVACRVTP